MLITYLYLYVVVLLWQQIYDLKAEILIGTCQNFWKSMSKLKIEQGGERQQCVRKKKHR
jgi:hypothetical protein